jgi:hypothetical protein
MLAWIPPSLFILEWLLCLAFGLHFFGDTSMRRLGEITLYLLLWMLFVRLILVGASFVAYGYFNRAINQHGSKQSLGLWSKTIAKEYLWTLFAFSILVPLSRWFAPRIAKPGAQGETIVLFIHGLVSSAGVWWLFAKRFQQHFPCQIDTIELGPAFQSLDLATQRLTTKIALLEARKPARIILIGHSMGGLVA